MYISSSKDINAFVQVLLNAGWTYVKKKKHFQLFSPMGVCMTVSCTPSDRRAFLNLRAIVRRIIRSEQKQTAVPADACSSYFSGKY